LLDTRKSVDASRTLDQQSHHLPAPGYKGR
jgi:hypothetical protein